jgi:hypothetical protein
MKSGGDELGEYWRGGGVICFCQKLLFWYSSVRSRVVMQQEPASSFLKLRSRSAKSSNQTRQYSFLIHRLTWCNKLFENHSQTVAECDQLPDIFFFCFLNNNFVYVLKRMVSVCLGMILETRGLITVAIVSSKERSSYTDWTHSWQNCSLRAFCSKIKQCGSNPVQIFHYGLRNCFSANFKFLFHHPKSFDDKL